MKSCNRWKLALLVGALAAAFLIVTPALWSQTIIASTAAQLPTPNPSQIPGPPGPPGAPGPPGEPGPPALTPYRTQFEISSYDNAVNNNFGQWYGGGLHFYLKPSNRVSFHGESLYQRRPGESEQMGSLGTWIRWADWFSTNVAASGGGPDDPAAFFPRFRYDANGYLKTPVPGLLLTGGYTRLYFGNPVGGRIARAGLIQYAGRFVFQGLVNFYNARPGNHESKSVTGAVQYGQEGRYWVGLTAGGGREAWQTLGSNPFDVEFTGYNLTAFTRKWITPSFGITVTYNYYIKHAAYRYNGAEFRLFWQF